MKRNRLLTDKSENDKYGNDKYNKGKEMTSNCSEKETSEHFKTNVNRKHLKHDKTDKVLSEKEKSENGNQKKDNVKHDKSEKEQSWKGQVCKMTNVKRGRS